MINDWTGKCPLTGKSCNQDKVILGIQTVDGKTNKFAMCVDCAGNFESLVGGQTDAQWRNFLETIFHGMHISQMFGSEEMEYIFGSIKSYNDLNKFMEIISSKPKRPGVTKCTSCGLTVEELFKNGKLGCPKCWEDLQPWIGQITAKAQDGGSKHVGKSPKNQEAKVEDTIEQLEEKMKQAAQEERYEDAATIRDAIRARRNKSI